MWRFTDTQSLRRSAPSVPRQDNELVWRKVSKDVGLPGKYVCVYVYIGVLVYSNMYDLNLN